MRGGRLDAPICPNIARLVRKRGPVEPGLMAPAFLLALLTWRLTRKMAVAMIPAVEPHTINSILGASEKWSIIPATYILVERRAMRGW